MINWLMYTKHEEGLFILFNYTKNVCISSRDENFKSHIMCDIKWLIPSCKYNV